MNEIPLLQDVSEEFEQNKFKNCSYNSNAFK